MSEEGPDVGVVPMRRLTQRLYRHAIGDLLGEPTLPENAERRLLQITDGREGGFASTVEAPSTEAIRGYVAVAEELAPRVVADHFDAFADCDRTRRSCVRQFVGAFGRALFRRPLDDAEEIEPYLVTYDAVRDEVDADAALEVVVTSMLASPHFLYLAEAVEGAPTVASGAARIDAYAFASRLSFFLWESAPDDALLAAAGDGTLDTPEGTAAEVDRMLADPRARRSRQSFFSQWLQLEHLEDIDSSDPAFDDALRASMQDEAMSFIDYVLDEDDGTLRTVLSAPYTVGDDAIAALYESDAPAGGRGRIALDPAERAGILTQPGFLAQFGVVYPEVHRGLWVRRHLLCDAPPPPPADVALVGAADRLSTSPCQGCHVMMDLIGFGFADYDALGRFRPEDAMVPPAAPEVFGDAQFLGAELVGEFDGARELADRLANSDVVHHCFASELYRYATGRAPDSRDTCTIAELGEEFAADGHIPTLIRNIALSESLRLRTVDQDTAEEGR